MFTSKCPYDFRISQSLEGHVKRELLIAGRVARQRDRDPLAPIRFPAVAMHKVWPDDGLNEVGVDSRTAIVTLTHDPKLDDPALKVALGSEAFYIGALGSRRTHAARCQRLTEAGIEDAALERIHAPVGLDIGARSPAEIAVSVMAEVTTALRTAAKR